MFKLLVMTAYGGSGDKPSRILLHHGTSFELRSQVHAMKYVFIYFTTLCLRPGLVISQLHTTHITIRQVIMNSIFERIWDRIGLSHGSIAAFEWRD
jgi:hypothetical protein